MSEPITILDIASKVASDVLVFNCINNRLYYTSSVICKKYGGVNVPKSHIDQLYRKRTTGVGTFE